jgi:hypothetical protein
MIRAKTERSAGKRMMVLSLLVALMAVGLMLTAKPAHADTTFTVTSTSDFTGGSLRAAISNANNTPGADTINFNISGSGVKTIRPLEALPDITEAVTINGYSQPGATLNTLAQGTNANLLIQLDLANAGGLEIEASNSVVRGLVINNSPGSSVSIRSGTGNRIEGNFIGTDASGTLDRDNFGIGAQIDGGSNNTIGGTSPAKRNLISANGAMGIEISSNGTGDNVVQGNLIGTQKDGVSPLGNSGEGVYVDTSDNTIGGTGLGAANVIAFNNGDGVFVEFVGVANTGNRISGNSIFSNGGLGIDLRGGTEDATGATANDPKDPDQGANDLQNKPVITSAKTVGGTTTIQAKLNSTPSDPFVVEFFSNPSGEDEGKKFIGNKAVSTNSNGNVTFTFVPSQAVAVGQRITATATNVVDKNTSEFSAPRTVVRG